MDSILMLPYLLAENVFSRKHTYTQTDREREKKKDRVPLDNDTNDIHVQCWFRQYFGNNRPNTAVTLPEVGLSVTPKSASTVFDRTMKVDSVFGVIRSVHELPVSSGNRNGQSRPNWRGEPVPCLLWCSDGGWRRWSVDSRV